MAPLRAEQTDQWTRQIQDAIAGDSGLREGLNDDEALPLVNWGAEQAGTIAERLAADASPPPDAEQVANTAYTLGRLMSRMNWVVTYRTKKDAAWLTRTFSKINALSQEVFGPGAPTLSDDEITAWIADQPNHTNGDLLRGLIARLTPSGEAAPIDAPADTQPVAPEPSEATAAPEPSPSPPEPEQSMPPAAPAPPAPADVPEQPALPAPKAVQEPSEPPVAPAYPEMPVAPPDESATRPPIETEPPPAEQPAPTGLIGRLFRALTDQSADDEGDEINEASEDL